MEIKTYKNEEIISNVYELSSFENIEETTDDILLLNIENKDIHKTTIEEGSVEFTEQLTWDLSYRLNKTELKIEDTLNEIYNNEDEISEEAKLKYLKTKLDKNTLFDLLGEDGKLTITDINTNKVLAEITKQTIEAQRIGEKVEQSFEEVIDKEIIIEENQDTSIVVETEVEDEETTLQDQIVIETENEQIENIIVDNEIVEDTSEETLEENIIEQE